MLWVGVVPKVLAVTVVLFVVAVNVRRWATLVSRVGSCVRLNNHANTSNTL